jgi:hypothetical protein
MGWLVVYPGRENPTAGELDEFVKTSQERAELGSIAMMEDPPIQWSMTELRHPNRDGELVGAWWVPGYADWVFTPGFVKECYASSKEDDNALCHYMGTRDINR